MDLKRRICPGCGAVNPKSKYKDYFACQCGWEIDGKRLPTLDELLRKKAFVANDVDLPAYLRSLLEIKN